VPPFTYSAVAGCTKDEWCWSTPTPQGNPLYSIWGSGTADVWAVGESGAVVHWDGKAWTQVHVGTNVVLRGVWAAGPKDAWIVGDDSVILRWNGAAWNPVAGVPTKDHYWRGVWGTGPNDVWIVGGDQTVAGPDGNGGSILHWNGQAWATHRTPQALDTVWGTGPKDVWSLGEAHGLFHWDGQTWSTVPTDDLPQVGTAIWGASSRDLWLGGRSVSEPSHWTGQSGGVHPDQDIDINGLHP
jgi:hypothetical protein